MCKRCKNLSDRDLVKALNLKINKGEKVKETQSQRLFAYERKIEELTSTLTTIEDSKHNRGA